MTAIDFKKTMDGHKELYDKNAKAEAAKTTLGEKDAKKFAELKALLNDNLDQLVEVREIKAPSLETASDSLLYQRLQEAENVYPTDDMSTILTNRMAPESGMEGICDKHCFGLFFRKEIADQLKPEIAEVPLAAVYTKLFHLPETDGEIAYTDLPHDIPSILHKAAEPVSDPNTIMFYSISNLYFQDEFKAANPLPGLQMGPQLIQKLQKSLMGDGKIEGFDAQGVTSQIKMFSTLSPMSQYGEFRKWLKRETAKPGDALFALDEQQTLLDIAGRAMPGKDMTPTEAFWAFCGGPCDIPNVSAEDKAALYKIVQDLSDHYLMTARRPVRYDPEEKVRTEIVDNVASFHWMNNGLLGLSQVGGNPEKPLLESVTVNHIYPTNPYIQKLASLYQRGYGFVMAIAEQVEGFLKRSDRLVGEEKTPDVFQVAKICRIPSPTMAKVLQEREEKGYARAI